MKLSMNVSRIQKVRLVQVNGFCRRNQGRDYSIIYIIVTAPFLIYNCDIDGSNERNGNMDVWMAMAWPAFVWFGGRWLLFLEKVNKTERLWGSSKLGGEWLLFTEISHSVVPYYIILITFFSFLVGMDIFRLVFCLLVVVTN